MRLIESSEELKKYYNYLFFNDAGHALRSQIWIQLWYVRKNAEIEAKIGAMIPPCVVGANTPVPFFGIAPVVDIDIHFTVDEPLCFKLKNVKLPPTDVPIGVWFQRAVKELGGEYTSPNEIKGYVSHTYKNQKAPTTYEVTKIGSSYVINKMLENGNKQGMSADSSRMKTILKKFESQLTAGTLQTEFAN